MSLPPDSRERFKLLCAAASADAPFELEQNARRERRLTVVPQLLALLQQFGDGTIQLPDFQKTFDAKTRKD